MEDRRQTDAVDKITEAIYSWGRSNGEPMFVISEFKFTSYLCHAYDKKTRKKPRSEEWEDGDHDIVVISLKKGIIFFQVKSVDSSSKLNRIQKLKDAFQQVSKDRRMMKIMNRDLDFVESLPILSYVGVPNLSDNDLDDCKICAEHKKTILTRNHLLDGDCFKNWWEKFVWSSDGQQAGQMPMSHEQYKELCGRYVGQASTVRCGRLHDAIKGTSSRIRCLILNPEQTNILSCKERLNILLGDYGTGKSLLIIAKAVELAGLSTNDKVYVISFSTVSSGSGKIQKESDNSIDLLNKFSKEKGGKNLIIRSFYDHITHIEGRDDITYPEKPFEYPLQLTPRFLSEIMKVTCAMDSDKTVHFLFDEIPLCIGREELGGWEQFVDFCKEHTKDDTKGHVWMSIATYSYALAADENALTADKNAFAADTSVVTAHEDVLEAGKNAFRADANPMAANANVLAADENTLTVDTIHKLLLKYLPTSFRRHNLTLCMRMCRKNFYLVKAVRKFKGDAYAATMKCGNIIHGHSPMVYELKSCTCLEKPSSDKPYECGCITNRLKTILESVRKEFIGVNEVVIILHDTSEAMTQFLVRKVEEACTSMNVRINFKVSSVAQRSTADTGENDGITLVDHWSYKGSEENVVIYIDPYGGPLVWKVKSIWHGYQDVAGAFSRALSQIFYVTWPEEEQSIFAHDLADYLEKTAPAEAEDPAGRHFKLGIANEIRNGRKGHKWEGRKFIDFLVEEGVILRPKEQESK